MALLDAQTLIGGMTRNIRSYREYLRPGKFSQSDLGRAGKEFCIRYRDELISDHAR